MAKTSSSGDKAKQGSIQSQSGDKTTTNRPQKPAPPKPRVYKESDTSRKGTRLTEDSN